MSEKVAIQLLVDKFTADEISKKNFAEIALRRADAKFKSMVKCKVLGTPVESPQIPKEQILNAFDEQLRATLERPFLKINSLIRSIQDTSNDNATRLTALTNSLNNMSLNVENTYSGMCVVKSLSFLNTGLGLANLVSSVVGYVVIGKKINELNAGMQALLSEVTKISNIQKNEIISECRTLVMQFNMITDRIINNEEIPLKEIEELIIAFNAFINKIMDNLNDEAMDIRIVSEMVFTLLPAYTMLLKEFITRYYFTYGRLPGNYETFMALYSRLKEENFEDRIQDFYMLEQDFTYSEYLDVIGAQTLLVFNNSGIIEDQVHLLEMVGTKDNLDYFETEIDRIAQDRINQLIPCVAEKIDMEETELKQIFA